MNKKIHQCKCSNSNQVPRALWLLTGFGYWLSVVFIQLDCTWEVHVLSVWQSVAWLSLCGRGDLSCVLWIFFLFPTAAPRRTATQLEGWFCHQSDLFFICWLWEVKDACSKKINHLWIWNNFTKGMGKQAASHRWVGHLNVAPRCSLLPSMPALGNLFLWVHTSPWHPVWTLEGSGIQADCSSEQSCCFLATGLSQFTFRLKIMCN